NSNTALGDNTLANLTSGVAGVYIGNLAGAQITTGGANVCVGSLAGFNYAGNEHSNICIGSGVEGTLGENNTLRIGEGTGTGAGFLNKAYICGIRSINVGSVATVVTENNDQLGTATITAGTGISIVPGPNTITIEASGAVADSFNGDSGTAVPSLGVLDIEAGVASLNCGSSVFFQGSGHTIELNVTDASDNTIIGNNAGNLSIIGNSNTVIGQSAGNAITNGIGSVMVGNLAGSKLTTGGVNTLIGALAGFNYTGNEHSNICLGYSVEGTLGENNTLRIGDGTGSGVGQIAAAYISGIDGVNVGSVATVVTEAGDKLGTAVLTAGTGITITPSANAITIAVASSGVIEGIAGDLGGFQTGPDISIEAAATAGSSVDFSGSANIISLNVTDANSNTIIGLNAGNNSISGDQNTALGKTSAQDLTTGTDNTLIGFDAGASLTTGAFNVLLGSEAGSSYTSSESSNIIINASGTIADSHTLRIGSATGTGNGELNKAFICGINGINVGSVATVVTEASNQLGTAVITAGSGMAVTPGANVITLSTAGSVAQAYVGDSGTSAPSAGSIHINAGNSSQVCGSSVEFFASGSTVQLNVTSGNNSTIIGKNSGNATQTGTDNTVFGYNSATSLTS